MSGAGSLTAAAAALSVALSIWPAGSAVARARLSRLAISAAAGVPRLHRASRLRALFFAGLAGAAVMAIFPSAVGGLAAAATAAGSYLVLVASVPSQGSSSRVRQAVVAARSRGGRFARTTD
ncbi:MAG: hypothetical protein H0V41_14505, partial [Pseudonocardiales bacterium]|nr:hypothetical protein [Pseudonocardiales bacterium]